MTFSTYAKKTKKALLWMHLANEPFIVLYTLLPFIIRKDLNASLVQLSILASLRPVLSLFSFYWSANLTRQKKRLRSNLIGAWLLARLPFLFIYYTNNAWYLIFCCGVYELLNRSGNPALMEILKINLQKGVRERIYNFCFVLSFLESILLGFVIGNLLTNEIFPWQGLFAIAALLTLSSIYAQLRVPLPTPQEEDLDGPQLKITERIFTPWKDAFTLLKSRPDFFRFQCGFMLGGMGLMLAAPSLTLFCVDVLQLSHGEITTGRSILMGVGVTVSSYFWNQMIILNKIEQLLIQILVGFSLYLTFMFFAGFHFPLFYISYFLYGVAQAGSHLLWNLSGPLFAEAEESSQFSRVNILMVGLRGAVMPALGGILCNYFGPAPVILLSSSVCFIGAAYLLIARKKKEPALS